ncbi:hypothetical protein AAMO2058_001202900 [Amorphochlora amoebiformis]
MASRERIGLWAVFIVMVILLRHKQGKWQGKHVLSRGGISRGTRKVLNLRARFRNTAFGPRAVVNCHSSPSILPLGEESAPYRIQLKGMTKGEIGGWLRSIHETEKRGEQIWGFMYGEGLMVRSWDQASKSVHPNGFSDKFVAKMKIGNASIDGDLFLVSSHSSPDGTTKFLFRINNGGKDELVETVAIPMERTVNSGKRSRITVCVSSQIGCAMGCSFCYTGLMGLRHNLTAGQIVEQVLSVRRLMTISEGHPPVTNVVFMGMGEPFHNFQNVQKAIDILTTPHPNTRHLSGDRITVSTVGLIPQIIQFVKNQRSRGRRHAQLAVSLHGTYDSQRSAIMKQNLKYNISALIRTLEELFPRGSDESVLIEYLLLNGTNDSPQDAKRLLNLLSNIQCIVNLIEFNAHNGSSYRRAEECNVAAFETIIRQGGVRVNVRRSRGSSKMAACGQLGSPVERARPAKVQFKSTQGT